MKAVFAPASQRHDPGSFLCRGALQKILEQPARVQNLLTGVQASGLEVVAPRDFGLDPILDIHAPDYIEFLRTAYADWQAMRARGVSASETVQSSGFSLRHRYARVPSAVSARADYYLSGGWAPLAEGTFEAAVASAHSALEAAEIVLAGGGESFALCRPPGHHAYADLAGGFCYINNAAVAAQRLARDLGRVSILDIDAHHGNGTQGIFYERNDVQFVSLHADPTGVYPFYCGFADETGQGPGAGFNLNLPLSIGSADNAFIDALRHALGTIRDFRPSALVLSLGLDIHEDDPTKLLSISGDGLTRIGALVGAERLPIVVIQEGGYDIGRLSKNLRSFLDGFVGAR